MAITTLNPLPAVQTGADRIQLTSLAAYIRAERLVAAGEVHQVDPDTYEVGTYRVDLVARRCTCSSAMSPCPHLLAVAVQRCRPQGE